ncbi:MAG: GNAT family N-acetyltransferase [Methylobacterium mesophilicum]|nr:GNAT family N-acetyltransferase [Methylobacterium mesophilicum]
MFVRSAGERDLPAVRKLLVETWHATYDAIYGVERVNEITDEWHSIAALRSRLKRPRSEFLVADDGETTGGMAYAAESTDPGLAMLHQLYVLPRFQRQGVGTDLLHEIENSFPEARCVRLEVEEANRSALRFYAAHGFKCSGEPVLCGGETFAIPALMLEKPLD